MDLGEIAMKKENFEEAWEETSINENRTQKIISWIKRVFVILIVIVAVGFGVFYKIKFETIRIEFEKLQEKLLEIENETITATIIEEKLNQIAELATVAFEYSGILTKNNYRDFFKTEINIPFTKNEITVEYKGVIKVGYALDSVEYKFDEESKKIYMSLPESEVTDHYMIQDELKFEQKNNLLNPISIEEINRYLINIEKEELIRAEEEGIYKKAEERMKGIIENYFAEFENYEVIFM